MSHGDKGADPKTEHPSSFSIQVSPTRWSKTPGRVRRCASPDVEASRITSCRGSRVSLTFVHVVVVSLLPTAASRVRTSLIFPCGCCRNTSASGHSPTGATPPSWRIFPAPPEEIAQTQLVCLIFGVVCLSRMSPRPRTVRSGMTTTVYPWSLTPTGRDQATSSRGRLYRKRKYCYFPVRSPALCIFQLHVNEVGRTVSLRDEGLPLTIFPDFPTFGYIFVVRYCIGLHVWVRAYCWLHVFLKYILTDALNYEKAPSSHRGAEGTWRWLRFLVVPVLRRTTVTVPLVPVQMRSMELPATTVGEWRRRHSL